jgi:hypothetical protein
VDSVPVGDLREVLALGEQHLPVRPEDPPREKAADGVEELRLANPQPLGMSGYQAAAA